MKKAMRAETASAIVAACSQRVTKFSFGCLRLDDVDWQRLVEELEESGCNDLTLSLLDEDTEWNMAVLRPLFGTLRGFRTSGPESVALGNFTTALAHSPIEELDFGEGGWNRSDTIAFARGLRGNHSLKKLAFYLAFEAYEAAGTLVEALCRHTGLVEVEWPRRVPLPNSPSSRDLPMHLERNRLRPLFTKGPPVTLWIDALASFCSPTQASHIFSVLREHSDQILIRRENC